MEISEKSIEFLNNSLDKGRSIPGQSLVNSPQQPYNWERPPEFTNPNDTMLYIFSTIMEEESAGNILLSLRNKVGVIDIASIILYSGFLEGKWNPDLMTLLLEPTMYMIMALAEKAEINYVLESGDDELIELDPDQKLEKSEKILNLQELKLKARQRVSPQSVPDNIRKVIEDTKIQPSLLEKVKQENNNNSLLSKEEK